MKLYSRRQLWVLSLIIISLILIGSFYDYHISVNLYDANNLFGIFLAGYGQLPAMICLICGAALLVKDAYSYKDRKKGLFVLTLGFVFLIDLFVFVMLAFDTLKYIPALPVSLSVIIALIIILIFNILTWKIFRTSDNQMIRKTAWFLLLTPALTLLVINLIKTPWQRPRMRLISVHSEVDFQPWWTIGNSIKEQLSMQGIQADEFKSFPSAHTASAACMMTLCVLPFIHDSFKKKRNVFFYGSLFFTLTVGLSRIIAGAHFLRDITFGMMIAFMIQGLLVKLIFKENGQDVKEENI